MDQLFRRMIVVIIATVLLSSCATRPSSPPVIAQNTGALPRFTHPADITNPFFPVSLAAQAIFLGVDGVKPTRNEVTLIPTTERIAWGGQQIEARVAQFIAYTDGKLVEVAYDYYAQGDDGSVYYLGEDVTNYVNGKVNHEGSWLAGKDGAPPALIMPAHPEVGQKFNPENTPGVALETDEILSMTEKVTTPSGEISNGMLVKETQMDGSIEQKVYAANFGIIIDRGGNEELKLVLYNLSDAKQGIVPDALSTIENQAEDIFDIAPDGQWEKVSADAAAIREAWQTYQVQAVNDHAPQPFQDAMAVAIDRLAKTSAARDKNRTLQAANDVSAAVTDLYTIYHPTIPVDLGRLDVLGRQVGRDIAANDMRAAADSLLKTRAIWARLKPAVLAHKGAEAARQFEKSLTSQQAALDKGDSSTLANEARSSLDLIDVLEKIF